MAPILPGRKQDDNSSSFLDFTLLVCEGEETKPHHISIESLCFGWDYPRANLGHPVVRHRRNFALFFSEALGPPTYSGKNIDI
jgi:hypothetical protein